MDSARDAGWRKPILLLEGVFEVSDLRAVDELRLTPVVHHEAQVEMLTAFRPRAPIDVYVKVNTGMNRLGFDVLMLARVIEALTAFPAFALMR